MEEGKLQMDRSGLRQVAVHVLGISAIVTVGRSCIFPGEQRALDAAEFVK